MSRVGVLESSLDGILIHCVQEISRNQKNILHLHLETHPLPFQPSPVLVQLLQNDRRRRSGSILAASAKQRKQQLKSADYLDRKASEARRQLASGVERDFRQFCYHIKVSPDEVVQLHEQVGQHHQSDNQQRDDPAPATSHPIPDAASTTVSIEDTLRLHLAHEWVHQERFNIQEAFTNQTKKLQEDLDTFLDQQEAEFGEERQKVLNASIQERPAPQNKSITLKQQRRKTNTQFQSNTKRGMIVHTAPLLRIEPTGDGEDKVQWTASSAIRRPWRTRSDVDITQERLDELERRLRIRKEVAEAKRKDGMQWIGRQCAHLFAQVDCKETEARVAAMVLEEELKELGTLRARVSEISSNLERVCNEQNSKLSNGLPRLPSSNSAKRMPQTIEKNTE
ncbi:hypothetical protein PHYSODRAFT_293938 [Phytophthora sojae]|uniref:Uncharacterized protein n=1 Tax=Phytophthora sojae (strain P6497) TaxID=1094619 RepID=G4YG27_PHYSP|nr:hypothetical protein PHYSODRAFT_293938 [Phytophthora sojae]EGZ28370.1 hypothetical protein PHYSODRAFT_293938 [Phytophthora sojae]|eukprot:XP_009515645.1 hypothetical protein PHYSODRAFT_293938 [Phytophthora sojae]